MTAAPPPGPAARPRVVIIGAGFGGLSAARQLEGAEVEVTIIDRNNFHTFQPLLYQVATAGLNVADVAYPVRSVFQRHQHVAFRQGTVLAIDWDARRIDLDRGTSVNFDHLIVAAGSSPNWFGTPGAEEHGFPLYSLEQAARLRNHILRRFEAADADPEHRHDGSLNFVVVGGGPTGVEVAGALAELIDQVLARDFHTMDARRARVVLVEASDTLLAPFSPGSQRFARRVLTWRGVDLRLGEHVKEVGEHEVHLGNGEIIPTRTLIWAAGIMANPIADLVAAPAPDGGGQGRGGRIVVGPDLSVPGRPDVYAIGDIADMAVPSKPDARFPQLAQVAMQGGEHAAHQILRRIAGQSPTPFRYFDKGIMATIGRRAAVAELPFGPRLTGMVAWVAWLALHLVYLMGMRNRASVFVNWAWNYFTWDRGPRLIFAGAGDDLDDDHIEGVAVADESGPPGS